MMAAAGVVLVLLLLTKAAGMTDWQSAESKKPDAGKQKAAEYLLRLWNYNYPAKTASERVKDEGGGLTDWIFSQNPVYRFLKENGTEHTEYRDEDPAYASYRSNREFYEEHQYLTYYGDEESQQGASVAEIVVADGTDGVENEPDLPAPVQAAAVQSRQTSLPVIGTSYVMEQLADYDFLMKHFYIVHSSTTAKRDEMKASQLLGKDLSLEKDASQPQILIYHTHSQETFADYGPNNQGATVVGIGEYLTELLQAKGYQVIHHKTVYDLKNGELDRSKAYTYALDGITEVLQQNPSIQVILDVHRDGVKEGLHMVSEVNGKQTAPIMFFNGMSQTPEADIEHLKNPYKEDNLAFSLQMQVDAEAYFPGLTRKIYLKGLRYNLHLRPRSALIEVGAQTNTYAEALNAMEPLAELLDMVLQGD